MKIYCKEKDYTLFNGSMLDMLEVVKPNSVDAIVCDPPYELNFMGKGWDNSGIAFSPDAWGKCFEVLKDGGYLLAFGGSRTYHRIACAIEDAGFEIRDCIMWLYGCLSNDTEILTSNGWRNSETIKKDDFIYSLDLEKNNIIKNKVLNVFKYDYDGEMVNLKNQNTDQLLTPNHHCIVKDTIRTRIKSKTTNYTKHDYWCYKDAWQLKSKSVDLPLASNYNGSLEIGNLFAELLGWVISEGSYQESAITISQSSVNKKYIARIRYILGKLKIKYSEYTRTRNYKENDYVEHTFYLGKNAVDIVNRIKELAPDKKLTYKLLELSLNNKEFLLKGLCKGDGAKSDTEYGFSAFYQKDIEQLEVFQSLLHLTNKQGWINEKKHCCSIHSNPNTQLQGKHHKNRFVKYNGGYVWCIETEIGNFIAKRNGKIFITGNSGFPKSMNIGLAIDKKNGVESEVIGINKSVQDLKEVGKITGHKMTFGQEGTQNCARKDVPILKARNKWNGWGSQLKPAYEPIIIARKPFKGSLVDNVIEYGVGGLNIDECRVSFNGEDAWKPQKSGKSSRAFQSEETTTAGGECSANENGRFPANVILTYDETDFDEVCGGFPNTKSIGGSGEKSIQSASANFQNFSGNKKEQKAGSHLGGLGDSGSAARYFYCAKASKKDRDDGLDSFEEKYQLIDDVDEKIINEIKRLLNL